MGCGVGLRAVVAGFACASCSLSLGLDDYVFVPDAGSGRPNGAGGTRSGEPSVGAAAQPGAAGGGARPDRPGGNAGSGVAPVGLTPDAQGSPRGCTMDDSALNECVLH